MSDILTTNNSSSFFTKYRFWVLLVFAIIITRLPIISVPFNWLESFFHELSHGLAALITGGSIVRIELFINGAGLCTTRGGSAFFISFMGYAGAIGWGGLIYVIASTHQKVTRYITLLLLFIFALSIVLWVRDILTLFIVIGLASLFYLKWTFRHKIIPILVQLTGLLVLLNAVLSPLHLLDGRFLGDGAALSSLTGIPEIIWVVMWSSLGVAVLYQLGKKR